MGTTYYLIRRDTRTMYGLGKAFFLRQVFGDGESLCVTTDDVDTLVSLILAAARGDLDGRLDVSLHRRPDVEDEDYAYWRLVAADVVDWSEGQPFEFHSEHSGLYEDIVMDGWDRNPPCERLSRTGDRHSWGQASRDDLARRRRSDDAFRRGCVWIGDTGESAQGEGS